MPDSLSHFISEIVFLLPGRIRRSVSSNSLGRWIYCNATSGICSKTSKSVKFEICGSRITEIWILPFAFLSKRSVSESSSSRCSFIYGSTPATGISPRSSNISIPGSKIVLSPRNLLIISPFTRSLSSGSKSSNVPRSCANTPPRSISPTRSTGASTSFAIPIFTISFCLRLISAGEPAPSITMISASSSSFSTAWRISGISFVLYWKYSRARILPTTLPFTITCEPQSSVGFRRIGFI